MDSVGDNFRPKAIDLSHHVNRKSRARHPSPLKDIIRYMNYDGVISFAGGLPHPSLFPFGNISFSAYPPSTVLQPDQPEGPAKLDTFDVGKGSKAAQSMSLTQALQYGSGTGDITFRSWARSFIEQVFAPAYADYDILLTGGSTDAWNKVVGLLCEQGDMILCEEHTYPSAQALWVPLGCKAVPIKMDGQGMRADHLDTVLSAWPQTHPGLKRPHVLYLVPVGSNPAGTTMGAKRKQEIYGVCVKYDIVIVEDDPYYFLQYPQYQLGEVFSPDKRIGNSAEEYASSLVPSFLRFDHQGRVIRLETFSKTLAPGNRLGYFIANEVFTERLLRATEVETQAPSGWSQAIVSNLLHNWGTRGYLLWLSNLRDQYRSRRDWMCDAIARNFDLRHTDASGKGEDSAFTVFAKGDKSPIFSFVAPSAGMFIWAKFFLSNSPRFESLRLQGVEDPEQAFAEYVWTELAKALVLLTPGSYYTPWQGEEKKTTSDRGAQAGVAYLRLAFSMTSKEEMDQGVERMAMVLKRCWEAC